jgi:hypothetical protein
MPGSELLHGFLRYLYTAHRASKHETKAQKPRGRNRNIAEISMFETGGGEAAVTLVVFGLVDSRSDI